MKFVIFCEGYTERAVMADLLSRWLNPRVTQKIGFKRVRFDGWAQMIDDTPRKAAMHLQDQDVLGVISLLDLYGPTFYPQNLSDASARREWGMREMRKKVPNQRYRHHFAVHEVEAWLLSEPELLPAAVRKALPGKSAQPETINGEEPPAKLLNKLYRQALHKDYKKVVDGTNLFRKLNPELVYQKCPAFKALADDLLDLCPTGIKRTS